MARDLRLESTCGVSQIFAVGFWVRFCPIFGGLEMPPFLPVFGVGKKGVKGPVEDLLGRCCGPGMPVPVGG